MTVWILSFVPSERWEIAQQASMRTSSSREYMSLVRTVRAGEIWKKMMRMDKEPGRKTY
jgi:hypothetical protein